MFSTLALSTVLMTTSCCGGATWRPTPPAPAPTLAESIPLPLRIAIVTVLPTPFRSAVAPYLLHTEPKPKAMLVTAPAAGGIACPLCAGHMRGAAMIGGHRPTVPATASPAVAPANITRLSTPYGFHAVAASRDGRWVALVGAELRLLDAKTNLVRWQTTSLGDVGTKFLTGPARFAPNGEWLLVQANRTLRAFAVADGRELFAIDTECMRGLSFDISPDSRSVVYTDKETKEVVLWNVEARQPTARHALPQEDTTARLHLRNLSWSDVRFAPDGKHLLLAYKPHARRPTNQVSLRMLTLPQLTVVNELQTSLWMSCVEWLPDGKNFLLGGQFGLQRGSWDGHRLSLATMPVFPHATEPTTAAEHRVVDLAVSADGRRIGVLRQDYYGRGYSNHASILDAATGREMLVAAAGEQQFLPGRLALAGENNSLILANDSALRIDMPVGSHSAPVRGAK